MVELIARLGYHVSVCSGGDWGATVSNFIGLDYPERLVGIYLTMVRRRPPPEGSDGSRADRDGKGMGGTSAAFFAEESGYLQIQGTRPQTLAYGLTDSPAGLAGWIVEKLRAWSDCHGDLETAISRDDCSTNITLYWVTETANSSVADLPRSHAGRAVPADLRRVSRYPRCRHISQGNRSRPHERGRRQAWDIRHWTEMPKGGHFAALEVPDLLVADVRTFDRAGRRARPTRPKRSQTQSTHSSSNTAPAATSLSISSSA